MKHFIFLLIIVVSSIVYAGKIRDPFSLATVEGNYACTAIGIVGYKPAFALIIINNEPYWVKAGDKIISHEVVAIFDDSVLVRDAKKHERKIYCEN